MTDNKNCNPKTYKRTLKLRMKSIHNVSCHTCAQETHNSMSVDGETL